MGGSNMQNIGEQSMEALLNGAILSWTQEGPAGDAFRGYAFKAETGEVIWVDPPAPCSKEQELLKLGKPDHLMVTFRDHDRGVDEIAKRYGAKVWIPKGKGGSIKKVDVEYDEHTDLPGNLHALSLPAVGYGEHALYGTLKGHRFAFIGDAIMNLEFDTLPWIVKALFITRKQGQLQHKKTYRGGNTREALQQIKRLLNLDLDALLFSHGTPIESGAAAILKESVESWS